jgi:polar amino acid transport system permease protein
LVGLLHSIEIALGATCLGLLIGTGGAYGKLYGGPVVRDLLAVYTTIVRAVPELVLILLLYYAGTDLINQALTAMGYQRVDISGLAAGIAVLGFVQGAYSTEVIRGAILAIPQGQIEAARAYGMTRMQQFRSVIWPHMIRIAWPAYTNEVVFLFHATALVYFTLPVIGDQQDLMNKANELFQRDYNAFLHFPVAALYFLAVSLCVFFVFGLVYRRLTRHMPGATPIRFRMNRPAR